MRILLDTNIIIHREAGSVVRNDIGLLFRWLDRLRCEKWIHPATIAEISRHSDPKVKAAFEAKLKSYAVFSGSSKDTAPITKLRAKDNNANDAIDTDLIKEVFAGRVDAFITEDRALHRKAAILGIPERVFSIDQFLEKANAENPAMVDYRVLSVRKELCSQIDVDEPFFDSFRADYQEFDTWFRRKAEEVAYTCRGDDGALVAFLYLKFEGADEPYSDIFPQFARKRRLKIGTFKVVANGFKLGERFLKIVFDNALAREVDEIYLSMFRRTDDQERLYRLLVDWGFVRHGEKRTASGVEDVLVRAFAKAFNLADPRTTYPFASTGRPIFIVPIYPDYHTELFPDSILRTESELDFVESRPNRNAISKVYVSRSIERNLYRGDLIVFYRTKSGGPGYYTSVATTIAVTQNVRSGFRTAEEFISACRKRSVFTDEELRRHWDWNPRNRPFVVNFLYLLSLRRRPNLKELTENGIITAAPRGFERVTAAGFRKLLELAHEERDTFID